MKPLFILQSVILGRLLTSSKWIIFGFLCISIGLYPLIYFLTDRSFGLLGSKSPELLGDLIWNISFYSHITLGGLALLIGWTQFSQKLRKKNLKLHRNIGRIYVYSVLISGVFGLYIAQFATGGLPNIIGFSLSALVWLSTTIIAFSAIRKKNIQKHKEFMIYSYAMCFSAVTLRIWLPLLTILMGEFIKAYYVVAWLSWIPNLFVAYLIIKSSRKKMPSAKIA